MRQDLYKIFVTTLDWIFGVATRFLKTKLIIFVCKVILEVHDTAYIYVNARLYYKNIG